MYQIRLNFINISSKIFSVNALLNKLVGHRNGLILFNSLITIGSRMFNLIATLLTIPFLLKNLGNEQFTVYTLITSLVGFLMFSDMGLGFGLQNNIPEYEKDRITLKKAISSTFFFLSCLALIGIFLSIIIVPQISWSTLFNTSRKLSKSLIENSVLFFFLLYFISLPFNVANNYLIGKQMSYVSEKWKFFGNLFNFIAVFVIGFFKGSLPVYITIYFGINSIINIITFLLTFFGRNTNFKNEVPIGLQFFDFKMLKTLVKVGLGYFVIQLFSLMIVYVDNYLLAHFSGAAQVAVYIPLFKLIGILNIPLGLFYVQNLLAINHAIAKNDKSWVTKSLKRLFYINSVYSLIFSLIIYFGVNSILSFWLNKTIVFEKSVILAFCAYLYFLNFNSLISNILLGTKFLKYSVFAFPLYSAILLIGKFFFGKYYGISEMLHFGLLALVLFYFIPAVIMLKKKGFIN